MEQDLIERRKSKALDFIKKKYDWISYIILAIIVFIAVKVRSSNIPGLRDVTTGGWTLGPDLDPYLFLRWSKEIVLTGSLSAIDTMRYVPRGFNTKEELLLHPYMMAWFHKFLSAFGSFSVEQSAVIYPVFFFAITVIAFFFLTREIFIKHTGRRKAEIIALISAFFLTVLPSLLARTIAGIPEKESAAFFFLFAAFFFFLRAWNSEKRSSYLLFGALAGAATAAMALIWGGFGYIFLTLSTTTLISFVLGQPTKKNFYTYLTWILVSFALMMPFSVRYTLGNLVGSVTTGSALFILLTMAVHLFIVEGHYKEYFSNKTGKITPPVLSLILTLIVSAITISLVFGPSKILGLLGNILDNLIKPATSRLIQTVAENRQPFFSEWANSFGPILKGIPVFFWLFIIGSIYLFNDMIKKTFETKERGVLVASYIIFLVAVVFSRYASSSVLNGENLTSIAVYFGGILLFFLTAGYYYYKYHNEGKAHLLRRIPYHYILLFAFFVLGIVSARGAVRLIMVLVPPTAIIVSYFVVSLSYDFLKIGKGDKKKVLVGIILVLVLLSTLFSAYGFYKITSNSAKSYVPSGYHQQWQRAMFWVRENTAENAVFAHWWDYGYWLQGIGERATVLDGGNAVGYWNHLMGRHGLTSPSSEETLTFFYTHNVSHFLIDWTDIGKYSAFSSIGSNEEYDRASWIPSFNKDSSRTQERKNSEVYFYSGGTPLDGDIVYEANGTRVFLPSGKAALGGILIEIDSSGEVVSQPRGIFVYQNQPYEIPLRYVYKDGLIDFGSGIEAGAFVYPAVVNSNNAQGIDFEGSILYLSPRTVNSQLARLYLYGEEDENFKLAHSEDEAVVSQLKSQGYNLESGFINFGGFRGPIKIWSVTYPEDIQMNEEYLQRDFPDQRIAQGR